MKKKSEKNRIFLKKKSEKKRFFPKKFTHFFRCKKKAIFSLEKFLKKKRFFYEKNPIFALKFSLKLTGKTLKFKEF